MPTINISGRKKIRPLGSGGFGTTTLYESDNRRFVLKELTNREPKAIELFCREGKRLKEAGNHQQIPAYIDFDESALAIALEYVPGKSLREIFNSEDLFTPDQALTLLEELLEPLGHLHKHRIIHRDIKPANIIIHRFNQKPFIVDFGASKAMTETAIAKTQTVVGSPMYMPPEQTKGGGTFQSDIYSLGLLIMESMAGETPLDTGDWIDWHSAIEGIEQGFIDLLNKMVDRNLRDRFLTVEEVKAAIADLRDGKSTKSDILERIETKRTVHNIPAKRTVKGDPRLASPSLPTQKQLNLMPLIFGVVNIILFFFAANFLKSFLIGDRPLLEGIREAQELIHE